MSLKSDDNQSKEVNYQQFVKELEAKDNQLKQLEEKGLKMKLESTLKTLDISTKVETNQSINALAECNRIAHQIESNFETNPNPNKDWSSGQHIPKL